MTTFRSLIVALFAVILTASCSVVGGDDSEIIGSWELNGDKTKATWIGNKAKTKSHSKGKAKGDTLLYETPDGQTLQIVDAGETEQELKLDLEYTNEKITADTAEKYNLEPTHTRMRLNGHKPGAKPFRVNRRIITAEAQNLKAEVQFLFSCGYDLGHADEISFIVLDSDNNEWQSIMLDTDGFQEVLNDIFCG